MKDLPSVSDNNFGKKGLASLFGSAGPRHSTAAARCSACWSTWRWSNCRYSTCRFLNGWGGGVGTGRAPRHVSGRL